MDDRILSEIRRRNTIDIALYEFVEQRFERAVDRMLGEAFSHRHFAAQAPTAEAKFGLDLLQPVAGSGWDLPREGRLGHHRWMGGPDGASLYLPGRRGGSIMVRITIAHIDPAVDKREVSLLLDGRPMTCVFSNPPAGGLLLTATIAQHPRRNGNVVRLLTRTWRPPTGKDLRSLALAVSRVEIEEQSEAPAVEQCA